MPYERPWSALHPGCVIVLIDHSSSMNRAIISAQPCAGRRLADMIAAEVNELLNELVRRCLRSEVVSPRVEIAVIGYGDLVGS